MRLTGYGAELIEVADDGIGVRPEDYAALTQKYANLQAGAREKFFIT